MPKFKLPPRLPFRRLGIAGLGLIGGSLAKAFSPLAGLEISVYDSDPNTLEEAGRIRRFKKATGDLEEFLGFDLDLAYLCMPVHRNIEMIREMGRRKYGPAVTDSGSTKSATNLAALEAGLNYCGGHPIAGKEVAGFSNSSGDLIRGCLFILTPDERFGRPQKELFGRLKALHELLECDIRRLSPAEHDRVYSVVSHLPYLSAAALAGTVQRLEGFPALPYAGTGFRDSTRVGASPPEKWVAVVMDNAENLTRDLGALIDVLTEMKTLVSGRKRPELFELLDSIASYRRKLPEKEKKSYRLK
ncbi:MAG: prephenate dehydrogenase [Deltaproteobacteria bacterium]|jgi:prephenate dehydrogenase|nr:prephenate dehydrogenase [Deltaproteobacteria bacterium]